MAEVQRFVAPASPLDAISKALMVAEHIYGIKGAAAKADQIQQQMDQSQTAADQQTTVFQQQQDERHALKDPESDQSKIVKNLANVQLNTLSGSKADNANPSALQGLMKIVNDPKSSGYDVQSYIGSSPFLKDAVSANNKDMGLQFLAASMANRNANTQEKTDLNANKSYQSAMAPYENTIQAANRADHIINQIKNGDLKSTPTLSNDLNASVGSMFNNGKGATVYGMSHSDQASLEGRIQKGIGYLTGDPTNTIASGQLDQLQKDIGSLKSSYLDAHDVAYNSFREGLPDRVQTKLDARFNKFRAMANGGDQGSQASGSSLGGLTNSANAGESGGGMSDIQKAAAAEIQRRKASK